MASHTDRICFRLRSDKLQLLKDILSIVGVPDGDDEAADSSESTGMHEDSEPDAETPAVDRSIGDAVDDPMPVPDGSLLPALTGSALDTAETQIPGDMIVAAEAEKEQLAWKPNKSLPAVPKFDASEPPAASKETSA